MARTLPQHLKVHPKDPTNDAVLELIQPKNVDRLIHSTRLPGGFWTLSMDVPMNVNRYWDWRNNRKLFRIQMEEALRHVIWEGRLEVVELLDIGRVRLTARGYWSNFRDSYVTGITANAADYVKDFNETLDVAVTDMLQNGFHTDTLQLSTALDKMEAPGVTIDQTYNDNLSLWEVLTDSSRGLLTWPDSSDRKVDLAVWEDQEVYITARNPSVINWRVSLKGRRAGVSRFPVRVDFQRVANAVVVQYDTVTLTPVETDSASITETIRKEFVVPDIGAAAAAAAQERRGQELAVRKDWEQEADSITVTRLFDNNGKEFPLCRVRAGDVLMVEDFAPKSSSFGTPDLDALRTFVVEESICDHHQGTLRLRLDREGTDLADILARNKIT